MRSFGILRVAKLLTRVCLFCISIAGAVHAQQPQYGPELVAPTEARSPADERAGFHLPDGFDIQLVASEPDIHKPMNIAFDDRGRLWVTDTVEYPYPVKPGGKPRDTLKILSDFDADGRARKIVTFADGLNIPIGVLPLPDGALVHDIPNIYHLVDTDGDDKVDKRDIFYKSIGFRDTHGMTNSFTWGFDGWIYACHGFSNDSNIKGGDDKGISLNSGNIYRMRADGSHVEQFTHGQVNPFGLCFDSLGNLYSADCHSKPVYMLLRGAYYPSFGKPHDGLGYGPEMVRHDHGSTAICGVVFYEGDDFPAEFRGNVFIGNVVTNRINRDSIDWHGSSPKGIEKPDFLKCDDPWFRPNYITLGPDGALYVADFYNRIIGHYEVPLTHPGRDRERGRIWKISYRGKTGKAKPPTAPHNGDFINAGLADLEGDLDHSNLSVRIKAANELTRRYMNEASHEDRPKIATLIESLQKSDRPRKRVFGYWIAQRLGLLADDTLVDRAVVDKDREVRVHAMRILAERGELSKKLDAATISGLSDADPFVRRCAADAIGRHPAEKHVRPLLAARRAAKEDDDQLVHTIRMALRDQLRDDENWRGLTAEPLDDLDAASIADVALGVPSRPAATFVLAYLEKHKESGELFASHVRHIARHGDEKTVSRLFGFVGGTGEIDRQLLAARAIQQGLQERGMAWPEAGKSWVVSLVRRALSSDQDSQAQAAIDLAGSLRLKEFQDELTKLLASNEVAEPRRAAALTALATIDLIDQIAAFEHVLTDANAPIPLRSRAAETLARLNQEPARLALVKALSSAPGALQGVIAMNLAGSKDGGEILLKAVADGKASARLLQERGCR